MSKSQLPPMEELLTGLTTKSTKPLADILSLLFEPSPILINDLVPELAALYNVTPPQEHPTSYKELIDQTLVAVQRWPTDKQAQFVQGHPRIGEAKGLSAMSAVEQGQLTGKVADGSTGAPAPTPPEVLQRLAILNKAYEKRYPGLVYITFVNGRSRAQIAEELEAKLKEEGVSPGADESEDLDGIDAHEVHSEAWNAEVKRAVNDVGKIARSRLGTLGVD